MCFLTEEEKQKLVRGLLPKSREIEIANELRGWNWNQPPLEPIYEKRLALYEIASKYCSSARDLYLRKVKGVKTKWNQAMIEGSVLHDTLAELLVAAKRLIYLHGVEGQTQIITKLREPVFKHLEKRKEMIEEDFYLQLKDKIEIM
ncbi:CRISPR-associated protein Cas4 [Sporohalobacter salinus]|uniref:CRISPR-associated protein Cas4 n=1 Tax=Sporohalobacter salinus TaxID=1494606 RepID=UPI00195F6A2B|nr:CRISPR-associated protein Cas4 [Sporohalobacter salinus]MBM7623692.1 CRISPR/Cas system-associated exonuclease Cas4 (RecB family) [Sporohalobacter salinus]